MEATIAAGYPIRFGHSAGYRGYIAGQLYAQCQPEGTTRSRNRIFELSNNHGRIFRAALDQRTYVFIGAFSREAVDLLR